MFFNDKLEACQEICKKLSFRCHQLYILGALGALLVLWLLNPEHLEYTKYRRKYRRNFVEILEILQKKSNNKFALPAVKLNIN